MPPESDVWVCVCVCTQSLVLLGSCYGLQSHRCPTLALVPASSDSPPAGNTQATYRLPKALTDKGEDVSYTGKVSVIQSVVKLNQSQQKGRYIYMFMANYYKSQSGSLQCREADTCGSISSPFYLCSFFLKCSPPPLLCNHIDGVGLGPACSVGSSQTHSRGLRTDPRS